MNSLFEFMAGSPFLGFLLICSAYYGLLSVLRTVRIAIRGWPPPHCDSDGKFRDEPEVSDRGDS